MYNYVFIVCFANFVGYFMKMILFQFSIRTKNMDSFSKGKDFYYLENGICHILQHLFTSIEAKPTWSGIILLFVCRIIIIFVFRCFSKPSQDLVVEEADGNHKPDHIVSLSLPQTTTNFFILRDREVDWLQLPDHILSLVAIKLNRIKDFVRFGAVCQSWQLVYTENRHHMSRKPPLLMLATELNNDDQTQSLYSLAEKKVVDSRVQVPHNRHCCGSSHGWLVIVNYEWDITLFNPFSSVNNLVQLPSAKTFTCHPKYGSAVDSGNYLGYVCKIVLSANPTSNPNYVAVAIYGDICQLAFCKPGDKVWTDLDSECYILDIVYYEDQFYFVDHQGKVFSCDLNHPHPKVVQVAPVFDPPYADRRYLVESFGELLQVCRITYFEDDLSYYNEKFLVFKLDRVGLNWIKMDNLHGYVLFVGDNASYSISAVNFTEFKPNSIYFTDDFYEGYYRFLQEREGGGRDIGVFNLEDCTYEEFYPTKSKVLIPPAMWIEPIL